MRVRTLVARRLAGRFKFYFERGVGREISDVRMNCCQRRIRIGHGKTRGIYTGRRDGRRTDYLAGNRVTDKIHTNGILRRRHRGQGRKRMSGVHEGRSRERASRPYGKRYMRRIRLAAKNRVARRFRRRPRILKISTCHHHTQPMSRSQLIRTVFETEPQFVNPARHYRIRIIVRVSMAGEKTTVRQEF